MEVESAKEVLSRTIEDFKNSEEFKEEILEGGFASYYVRYEDGRDAVRKLYPDLDLSNIISPSSRDDAAKEGAAPTEDNAPTAPEAIPVIDAAPEHGDEDHGW